MEQSNYLTTRLNEYVHRETSLISTEFYVQVVKSANENENCDYESVFSVQCNCSRTTGKCSSIACSNFKKNKLCPKSCKVKKCENKGVSNFKQFPGLFAFENNFGIGIKTTQQIPSNTVILEYIGEIVSRDEYSMRQLKRNNRCSYGLETEEKSSRKMFVIDATEVGNISRFVNSDCQPNLSTIVEFSEGVPRVFLQTNRVVKSEEELTYKYGGTILERCECKTCIPEASENASNFVAIQKPHQARQSEQSLVLPAPLKISRENLPRPKPVRNPDGRFNCEHCDRTFSRLEHHTRHLDSLEKKYTCAKCPKSFPRKDALTRHMQTKHGEKRKQRMEKRFFCQFCEVGFVRRRNLHCHLTCRHNIDRSAF